MGYRHATLTFHSEKDTARFAAVLGNLLRPGDTVLLDGDIGAGKTFLARALIQSLQDQPEDVPSPTFTLVQTYDTRAGEIWHSDLYRISGTDEIEELGLLDAFETAICLVEWPDRLGGDIPADALLVRLEADATRMDERRVSLSWHSGSWGNRLSDLQKAAS